MPERKAPGRPKSDEKSRQIFEAAVALFTSQGYENTRVDEVARLAGVSKQTVYSHFDGKDHLFQSAMTYLCEQMGMPEGLERDVRPAEEVLTEIGGHFLRLLLSEASKRLYRLILANVDRHPDVAELFYATGPRTFIERLGVYLSACAARGELALEEPELAAAQFFAMMRGELHMRSVLGVEPLPTEQEIDHYIQACTRLFVAGYRPGRRHADREIR
jgi:TetR/AcrR family transcriptional repressor of mexJK operon